MGEIIKTKTYGIIPSQDFIKEGTIKYILECINSGELDRLPPTPIVRRKPDSDEYIAIDGHNLLVIYDLLDRECEVYIAGSKDDGLEGDAESIKKRNQDLKEKFDQVLEDIKNINIKNIKELRIKNIKNI